MKIKNSFYCITDKNNKPDYRYLFEDPKDALKRIRLIKNSTQGETLLVTKTKRDFFIDGVKRDAINPYRAVTIKKGCWAGLKVKKVGLMDTIEPKRVFKKIIKAENNQFSYSKINIPEEVSQEERTQKMPIIPNPFVNFDWETSFLRTKTFATGFAVLCLATVISVFQINVSTTNQITNQLSEAQKNAAEKMVSNQAKVLSGKDEKVADKFDEDLNKFVIATLKDFQELKQVDFENKINQILAGTPMQKMVPYIVKQDRTVAAFLVGIAKKESNWGQRVPVLNGQDCFNYWGYRGIRARMGSGGHTCFDSPEDAVNTVANRIQDLVQADVDTPKEMVIWKCGSACSQDAQASKWITDVNTYFNKVEDKTESQDDQS